MLLDWLNCVIEYLQNNADAFAIIGAAAAASWALYEFTSRRLADRKRLASELFEKFKEHSDVRLATQMLDWIGEVDFGKDSLGDPLRFVVGSDDVVNALKTLDEKYLFDQMESRIRNVFDGFMTEVEMLESYVKSGLIKDDDLRPFLGYWIELMSGNARSAFKRRPEFYEQIEKFAVSFGYKGVIAMMKRYGSLPSERAENDAKP